MSDAESRVGRGAAVTFQIEYAAAARRAQLDYQRRSADRAARCDSGRMCGRYRRQAAQHARRAAALAAEILVMAGAV